MANELFDVTNRVIVITGGLGLLGRQFTQCLVENGAKVVVMDKLSPPRYRGHFFGTQSHRNSLETIKIDITRRQSLVAAFARIKKKWGVPYGLVNNAALDSPPDRSSRTNGPFENYSEKEWDRIMEVNVKAVFLMCQIFGGEMAKAGRGSIINVNSIYGLVSPDQRIYHYRSKKGEPFFKPAAYSASKSALTNLTRYLATYWAGKNVRVNNLVFGGVRNHQDKEFLKGYEARVPMGRMANADEYNGAVLFLLSDASSYMTGSNMVLDGGWTAW